MALERLTQITNSGITSGITITGVNLTGVITATSANVGSGITLSGTQINVGSATTIHSSGFQIGSSSLHSTGISLNNINASGVVTATTFSGNLTGNVTGNATGLSGTPSITVATINASNATFSGNVSVAGTVTYEDVTNVDSVGLITARSGIRVNDGGVVLIGSGTSTGTASQPLQVTGGAYVSGNLGIGTTNSTQALDVNGNINLVSTNNYIQKNINDNTEEYILRGPTLSSWHPTIAYTRSTGTSARGFRFGSNDNAGNKSEWFSIWNGSVGINSSLPASTADVFGQQANTGSTSASVPTGTLRLAYDGASEAENYGSSLVFTQRYFSGQNAQIAVGQIAGVKIAGGGNYGGGLAFFTSNGTGNNLAERVRIDNSGNTGIGTNSPRAKLDIGGGSIYNAGTYQAPLVSVSGGYLSIKSQNADGVSRLTLIGDSATGDGIIDWGGNGNFNLKFTNNGSERGRFDSSGRFGIGLTNPQFQLQTTGNAFFNNQYVVDKYMGYFNDPGSYPEYMLLGRNNSGDVFRVLGQIYGHRGGGGERNAFFNICCSKTNYPSTSYAAGGRLGSASFALVTLTYAGNSWLALQSGSAGNSGGLNLSFTGQIYHSYSGTQWTHMDFYGSPVAISSGSVSSVSTIISF
ncbi:tail fiber protein [Synechococcus phage S-SRM01]|uniref:Tail fiber-like protein n=1 Tax=Synechococcus phage S-SRM01 TaxID=2781608 RepID=A0A879R1V6_9CAUD|nr:tail fiber protein [Synechococcus phage S-SRM01]QPX47971.1 tail fiber-like protein [Synechococcus phage S-SRM01]